MKKQHFYTDITEIETFKLELNSLDISEEEKEHLSRIIDASLHNTILDLILSELSEEEKKVFLEHLITDEHDKIWDHLNNNIDQVEGKIKKAASDLQKELQKDIEDVHNQ